MNQNNSPLNLLVSQLNFPPEHALTSQLTAKEVQTVMANSFEAAIASLDNPEQGPFDFLIVGPDFSFQEQISFVSLAKEHGYKGILAVVVSKQTTPQELTQLSRHYLHFFFDLADGPAVAKKVANLVGLFNIKEERNRLQRLEEEVEIESKKLVDANVNNVRLLADVNKKNKLLDLAKTDMQNLLDNLGQGFLLLNREGKILEGYSAAVEKIFKINPKDKSLAQLLGKAGPEADKLQEWIALIFSEMLDFSDLVDLGPKFWQNPEKFVAIEYRPIRNQESRAIEKVIVIATDKTIEKQLAEKHRQEENFAKMLQAVAKDRNGFKDFYHETRRLLDELVSLLQTEIASEKLGTMFRIAHSVKGNASAYQLEEVKILAHRLENYLDQLRGNLANSPPAINASDLKTMTLELLQCFTQSMSEVAESFGKDLFGETGEKRFPLSSLLQLRTLLQQRLGDQAAEVVMLDNLVFLDDFAPY